MQVKRLRLLCLPCAGASATMYLRWKRHLPAWIEIYPVERPDGLRGHHVVPLHPPDSHHRLRHLNYSVVHRESRTNQLHREQGQDFEAPAKKAIESRNSSSLRRILLSLTLSQVNATAMASKIGTKTSAWYLSMNSIIPLAV